MTSSPQTRAVRAQPPGEGTPLPPGEAAAREPGPAPVHPPWPLHAGPGTPGHPLPPWVAGGQTPGAGGGGELPLAPGLARLAAAMSEDELEAGVRRILKDLGLRLAFHAWKTHAKRASTGYPDWTITGAGGLMFRELKRQNREPTRAQQEWLDALRGAGADAGVWKPLQLLDGTVARELAALAGIGAR